MLYLSEKTTNHNNACLSFICLTKLTLVLYLALHLEHLNGNSWRASFLGFFEFEGLTGSVASLIIPSNHSLRFSSSVSPDFSLTVEKDLSLDLFSEVFLSFAVILTFSCSDASCLGTFFFVLVCAPIPL